MKKSMMVSFVLALSILLSACGAQAPASTGAGAVTVTDMAGREIVLEQPAARIVAVTSSDVEILYAIGAGNTIVGRGIYCDYPGEVLDIPVVESGLNLNVEQVMALQPDIVLMSTAVEGSEQARALEGAGVKVAASDTHDIEGMYDAIGLIGAIAGKDAEAKALIDGMKQSFAEIEEKSAGAGDKTIYFEISPLEYGLWTAGRGTFMDEIATMLGLVNTFADVDEWGEISAEQVIQRDPDYIVTVAMYFGEGPGPVEEILSRAGWENITAIQNGAVFSMDNDEIARPGPRLVNAAETLYAFTRG